MSHAPRVSNRSTVAAPTSAAPATPASPAPAAGATVAAGTLGTAPAVTQPAGSRFTAAEPPVLTRPLLPMAVRLDRTP